MGDEGVEQFAEWAIEHGPDVDDEFDAFEIWQAAYSRGQASLRAEVAQLKALLNYDGQRYESWLEVGQALIDHKAEVARLETQQLRGQSNADLEVQVARLKKERDEERQATTKRLNICAQEVFMTMRQAEEATNVAHDLRVKLKAAEARIRELEEK